MSLESTNEIKGQQIFHELNLKNGNLTGAGGNFLATLLNDTSSSKRVIGICLSAFGIVGDILEDFNGFEIDGWTYCEFNSGFFTKVEFIFTLGSFLFDELTVSMFEINSQNCLMFLSFFTSFVSNF